MITFNELLHGNMINDVPLEHQHNLEELLKRINIVRETWGKPMTITSGYRTMQEHIDIYKRKGVSSAKIPLGSAHLYGMAVDIVDPILQLTHWLQNDQSGIACLSKADLYCENGNSNWVHFQTRPTKHRWFLP